MKNRVVTIDPTKKLIVRSPGFEKKGLATHKIDLMGLCGFGCRYCSSNDGNFLRINRSRFAAETERQLGERAMPSSDPELTFEFRDVLERLDEQLAGKSKLWGDGKVLMMSQLTDVFSPRLVEQGVTFEAIKRILERTSFTIRILTKSSAIARQDFIDLFLSHRARVIIGCSTTTHDKEWTRRVECGTSSPAARINAIRALQDAGLRTYGMLCPIFPHQVGAVTRILSELRPEMLETVWVEPYNDRNNWRAVAEQHGDPRIVAWFERAFGERDDTMWSGYAADLFMRARNALGGTERLRYLLYEDRIVFDHARLFGDLSGVWLQCKPDKDGMSKNQAIRHVQMVQGRRRE